MKKNLLIGILSAISLVSLVFGYMQKVRADKNEETISILKNEAESLKRLAEYEKLIAERNAEEARRQEQRARDAENKK